MSERRSKLQTIETFNGLESFRNALNSVQSLADFAIDSAKGLLIYAEQLDKELNARINEGDSEVVSDREFEALRFLALNCKRNRMAFFNRTEGRKLRLSTRSHEQIQCRPPGFCGMCGTERASPTYTPHSSTFKCKFCAVHLCVRLHPGLRKNCWDLWHSSRHLEPRVISKTPTSLKRRRDLSNQDEERAAVRRRAPPS